MEDGNNNNKETTLYTRLCIVCNKLNCCPGKTTDVGSGRHARFQPTNNTIYSDESVSEMVHDMNIILSHYRNLMMKLNQNRSDRTNFQEKFTLYNRLLQEFDNPQTSMLFRNKLSRTLFYKGLSTVRINHLISFAALLGLIPIDYYVCSPLHNSGGVGAFMKNNNKKSEVMMWNIQIITKLREIFGNRMTPNMLENMLCIIARKKTRNDVYFMLPYINKSSKEIVVGSKIQLFFRINGHVKNIWNLELFNGKNVHTLFSSEYPILDRIIYEREGDGKLCTEKCHQVDKDWIERVLSIEDK